MSLIDKVFLAPTTYAQFPLDFVRYPKRRCLLICHKIA